VLDEMERLVLAEVDEATDAVRASSSPDPATLLTDVWANGGSQWRN
jgi:TPP-dependent pyruvate/acetoin dehydrogenase alpha subunit